MILENTEANMNAIKLDKSPAKDQLAKMGVFSWPIWEKEESEFPYFYDSEETCLILEGQVTVTPDGGQPVEIGPGDLVVFPTGLSCTWKITKKIRKHYHFA
jgi:hypothetical protein